MNRMTNSKQYFMLFFAFLQMTISFGQFKEDTIVVKNKVIVRNNQGVTIEVYFQKNGQYNGVRKKFNNQGFLHTEEYYKDGQLKGKRKMFDAAGNLQLEENYSYSLVLKKSVLNGVQKKYHNGFLISLSTYKDGKLEGAFSTYYADGKKREEGTYQDGLKTGKYNFYENDGFKSKEENYSIIFPNSADVKTIGKSKIKDEKQLPTPQKSSVLNGRCRYYIKGMLIKEANYKLGALDGLVTEYYYQPTYLLRSKIEYKDGQQHGKFEHFRSNGNLEKKGMFYHKVTFNGVTYTNVYDGENLFYFENGLLERSENWKNFQKHGEWKRFNRNGNLSYQVNYAYGIKTGTETYWDNEGNKQTEINYAPITIDGIKVELKHGTYRTWNKGILQSEVNYVNGLKQGPNREYYNNGTLKSEKQFVNDSIVGKVLAFYSNGNFSQEYYYIKTPKGSKKRGWGSYGSENGKQLKLNYHDDKDEMLIQKTYSENKISSFYVYNSFFVRYHPNGLISSFYLPSYNGFGFRFYSNGALRITSFYDENGSPLEASFTENSELIEIAYNGRIIDNQQSEKTAYLIAQKARKDWNNHPLFRDSIKNGRYILYYADDKLFCDIGFNNDLPDGKWLIKDPLIDDSLYYAEYKENNLVNDFLTKKTSGKTVCRKQFDEQGNLLVSYNYFGNGALNQWEKLENDKRIFMESFYENGKIKRREDIKKDAVFEWKSNGDSLYSSVYVLNPDSVRIIKRFYPDKNQLRNQISIHLSSKKGWRNTYYENGQLEWHYEIDENEKAIGVYQRFHPNGNPLLSGQYVNYKKDGLWFNYNEKGEITETENYDKGRLIIPIEQQQECACFDTTLVTSKIGFAQNVSFFASYRQLENELPKFIVPVDSFNLKHVYFINYQGTGGFASMKLLPYKPLSFYISSQKTIRFDLTPCTVKGYLNHLESRTFYQGKEHQRTTIDLKRIAITFEKSPLRTQDNKPFKAYFDAEYLELANKELKIEFKPKLEACFTTASIGNFLNLSITKGKPHFDLLQENKSFSLSSDFLMSNAERTHFNGIVLENAIVDFTIYPPIEIILDDDRSNNARSNENEIHCKGVASQIAVGDNWVAGIIEIKGQMSKDELSFRLENGQEVLLNRLEQHFKSHGFSLFDTAFLSTEKKLKIRFYSER